LNLRRDRKEAPCPKQGTSEKPPSNDQAFDGEVI
jgi:hypothetical protein